MDFNGLRPLSRSRLLTEAFFCTKNAIEDEMSVIQPSQIVRQARRLSCETPRLA